MAHLFCHSCGTKLEYAHAKPNFCNKCGQQLSASVSTSSTIQSPVLEKSEVISNDETDAQFVPHIENFQFELDTSDKPKMTFGSLMGESSKSEEKRRTTGKSLNEFIDEKKKEG